MIHVLSLGAGVQSSTVLFMADAGLIEPMPKAAVFADVGDEPKAVYEYLAYLRATIKNIPIVVTSRGTLSKDFLAGDKMARPPLFVRTKKGVGMLGRQCTRNYKVRQVRKAIRMDVLGVSPRAYLAPGIVSCWIGISTDEAIRAKSADINWLENRHPLIEASMSRLDCLEWTRSRGFRLPPKSSCRYCPYRTNESFRRMRDEAPEEFAAVVAFDEAIRSPEVVTRNGAVMYVHSSGVPIAEADLRAADEKGLLSGFKSECEGMCGV